MKTLETAASPLIRPTRARRATAADVARRAGVQQASVSVVLNGAKSSTTVSAAARERILEAARELNYQASAAARALVTGRTMQIAVVGSQQVWSSSQPGQLVELHGIMQSVTRQGYGVLVVPPVEQQSAARVAQIAHGSDGVCVLVSGFEPRFFEMFAARETPFVAVGNPGEAAIPQVDHDNYGQIFASVQWLLAQGHRKIMLVHPLSTRTDKMPHRALINEAYRAALRQAGTDFERVIEPLKMLAPAEIVALTGEHGATALITRGLPTTQQWRSALRDSGKRVPDEITILAQLTTEEVTYLRHYDLGGGLACAVHDRQTVGKRAGEVLLKMLEGQATPTQPVLVPGGKPHWYGENKTEIRKEPTLY